MADEEKVWSVPVTIIIIAPTFEEAFEAIAAALHEDPDVQTVGSNGGAVEDVEGTEELRTRGELLRWSCGEPAKPGETYSEHVKGCRVGADDA